MGSASGPIIGASPVNVATFKRHKMGQTVIEDSRKYDQQHPNVQNNYKQPAKQNAAKPAFQYNAYIDPDNPDDIVLSVPMDDNEFDDEDEGKVNTNNGNGHGYMYGMAQKYDDKHGNKGKNIAVAVNLSDDDDNDDFAQRPKVIKINHPSAQNKSSKNMNNEVNGDYDLLSTVLSETPSQVANLIGSKDIWQDNKADKSSDALLNGNYKQEWQTFAD